MAGLSLCEKILKSTSASVTSGLSTGRQGADRALNHSEHGPDKICASLFSFLFTNILLQAGLVLLHHECDSYFRDIRPVKYCTRPQSAAATGPMRDSNPIM